MFQRLTTLSKKKILLLFSELRDFCLVTSSSGTVADDEEPVKQYG